MEAGKLGRVRDWNGQRVTYDALKRFIFTHYAEIDLRRADQDWLKMLIWEDAHGAGRWL